MNEIAAQLEAQGLTVFWDWHIPPGVHIPSFLEEALKHSRLVLVIWSKESAKSEWVCAESEFARQRKRLVSCRIDNCSLSPPFNTFHTADLSSWDGEKNDAIWQKVVELIRFRVQDGNAKYAIGNID